MSYKDDIPSKADRVKRVLGSETDMADKIESAERVQPTASDKTAIIRARGGKVSGDSAKSRMDKPCRARGGRVKGKTTVNVIVAPQGQGQPQGAPGGVMVPPAPNPLPVPPGGAGGPPRPPMPAPSGMPPMRARGGRIKSENSVEYGAEPHKFSVGDRARSTTNTNPITVTSAADERGLVGWKDDKGSTGKTQSHRLTPMRQRGGRVKMTAGAGSAEGRLQKAEL